MSLKNEPTIAGVFAVQTATGIFISADLYFSVGA
jgi:hypothetical protein